MPTIADLVGTSTNEWYKYYPSTDALVNDYVEYRTINYKHENVFLKFLINARHLLGKLDLSTKKKLFSLLHEILPSLEPNNVPEVKRVLEIILRIQLPEEYASQIFDILSSYTINLRNSFLSDTDRSEIFWLILGGIMHNPPNYSSRVQEWIYLTGNLQLDYYLVDDSFWLHFFLKVWLKIRFHYKPHQSVIDTMVKKYVSKLIEVIPESKRIRETLFSEYIQHLNQDDWVFFKGMYLVITKNDVRPYEFYFKIPQEDILISIKSESAMSIDFKKYITDTITETYNHTAAFKNTVSAAAQANHSLSKNGSTVVTILDSKEKYIHYSSLWSFRFDNGGIAFIDGDQYVTFVYREAGKVRNLGHEMSHLFLFHWLGSNYQQLPSWFIEGSAEVFGNELCEENNFWNTQKDLLDRPHPTIPWIVSLDYSHGLSVYHWGSHLFRYLRKNHLRSLQHLLIKAENGNLPIDEFNREISQLTVPDFQTFITTDQNQCKEQKLQQLKNSMERGKEISPELEYTNYDWIDLNTQFEHGNTLLHLAIEYLNLHNVWWLLHKGARLDILNDEGKTPQELNPTNKELLKYILDYKTLMRIPPSTTVVSNLDNPHPIRQKVKEKTTLDLYEDDGNTSRTTDENKQVVQDTTEKEMLSNITTLLFTTPSSQETEDLGVIQQFIHNSTPITTIASMPYVVSSYPPINVTTTHYIGTNYGIMLSVITLPLVILMIVLFCIGGGLIRCQRMGRLLKKKYPVAGPVTSTSYKPVPLEALV